MGAALSEGFTSQTVKKARCSQHSANRPELKLKTGGFVSLIEIDKDLQPPIIKTIKIIPKDLRKRDFIIE
jgi:hypothetical protein